MALEGGGVGNGIGGGSKNRRGGIASGTKNRVMICLVNSVLVMMSFCIDLLHYCIELLCCMLYDLRSIIIVCFDHLFGLSPYHYYS